MAAHALRTVLARNVRRLLAERGMTVTRLAHFSDVSRAHLQDMLAGRKEVGIDWVERLARGLEVEAWKLFVAEKR